MKRKKREKVEIKTEQKPKKKGKGKTREEQGEMDLVCRNRFDGAFYHVLHDCVIPNVCNLESLQARRGAACYDEWQTRWIHLLAPASKKATRCYARPSKKECLVGPTLNRLLPPKAKDENPSDIVVLQRSNTRIFDENTFSALCSRLRREGKVVVYTGRESPSQTVKIFQKARYRVGYHGAGLVNAYFMNNRTRILEISTFKDLKNSDPWRSNMKEVTKYGAFETRILRIPIQQLLNANNVSYRAFDPDHYVKGLKYVSLTEEDVERIAEFVPKH